MRKFYDDAEMRLYEREREALKSSGFTEDEVRQFREIFQDIAHNPEGSPWEPASVDIFAVKTLLRGVGANLGPAQMHELKRLFDAQHLTSEDGTGSGRLQFPEFLNLVSAMLKEDFASLKEQSKQTVRTRELEKDRVDDLLRNVEETKVNEERKRQQVHGRQLVQRKAAQMAPGFKVNEERPSLVSGTRGSAGPRFSGKRLGMSVVNSMGGVYAHNGVSPPATD